ncbi:alpha-D-ribose 1-methylphosphonate 5-triphosphate diphosphatase [Roseomonas sp. SSH11]|uniref:Alpha-D-ribose 1-methylphosphonate 5-triphosphate diphosphatase n=1 Tax=Pararoseomonas baculiformis TaxID=2820812 RepID=A0ABS4AAR4_9PROT|nr:alpha-D-ribose 1-methylphosphonate 5-triphosphate diphosphatase [Pararoseomonas baculiformis]MBP0444092.1 alpha-D-ribose 1-methylphosphonate 5-triphosphate diphosphatase [Pararoseomonas baculiformis]
MWIADIRLALPDRVVPRAALRIEGGRIAEIVEGAPRGPALDGDGLLLIPGLVDLHGDMIEKEVEPRPGAAFPLDVAIGELDARLAASGVTTAYAGLSFAEGKAKHIRTEERARGVIEAVARMRDSLRVDLRVHARFEVTNLRAEPVLRDLVARGLVGLVSLTDHTPGQGQFRDVEQYVRWQSHAYGEDPAAAAARAQERMGAPRAWDVARGVTALAREQGLPIASHDDDTAEKVRLMRELGATISEFPVTLEAAEEARRLGMTTLMGAPNALRNASMTGNATARAVMQAGLLDMLAADYHQGAMLPAVLGWVREGLVPLHEAVALVTSNPARAAGLADRGTLLPGQRADLVLLDDSGAAPRVRAVWRAGQVIHSDGWSARAAAQVAEAA